MARPQSEHLQRSGNTPIDPDHMATEVQTEPHAPRDEPGGGPVPADNQPGHHPPEEQDKPDLDQFAERLGVATSDGDDQGDGDSREASGRSPASTVASTALGLASRARDLAEPVGRAVSRRVGQVTDTVDDHRHLAERVAQLEQAVAELQRDSTTG